MALLAGDPGGVLAPTPGPAPSPQPSSPSVLGTGTGPLWDGSQGYGGIAFVPDAFNGPGVNGTTPQTVAQTVTPKYPGPTPTAVNPGVVAKAGGDSPGAGADPTTGLAAAPGSITTDPGTSVDWTAAMQAQPGYVQAMTDNQQSQAQANSARQAALRAQTIAYGGLAPGVSDPYGDIDQATLDAAKNNQYSTMAGLSRNYNQSVQQFRAALAARGALQSGDLSYGQDQLDTGYGQNLYDAGNTFGNEVTGDLNAYTGVLDTNQQNLVSAINGASASAYADPANREVAPTTASMDAGLSSTYGRAIYKVAGGDGTLYTQDGSVFTPYAVYNPDGTVQTPSSIFDPSNLPQNMAGVM